VSVRPLVLIADDDRDILELVSLTLESDGYEVLQARNGEEALRIAAQRTLHLAVLDLMMPVVDGYEVTRRIRAAEGDQRLPILVLSAFAEDRQAALALAAGADAYMRKPFSPRALLATAGSMILERRPRSRLATET
jgi:two-component system, OmpR family, alkaline phosphatase synthesis response regulator PhoP